MEKYEPQEQDRVAVIKDGKITKGRVASVLGPNAVMVTVSHLDNGTAYEMGEVFPLYRYANHPLLGSVPVALCVGIPKQAEGGEG